MKKETRNRLIAFLAFIAVALAAAAASPAFGEATPGEMRRITAQSLPGELGRGVLLAQA